MRLWIRFARSSPRAGSGTSLTRNFESHIDQHIDEGVRSGLSEAEARRQALMRIGGAEQVRQAYRDRATLPWLESLLRDVRYALRGFRRNPVFAITAILTLALGIGATTAVFSVVDRILFRALPYAHDDQLVSLGLTAPIGPPGIHAWRLLLRVAATIKRHFTALTSERGVNECDLTERNPRASELRERRCRIFCPHWAFRRFSAATFCRKKIGPNGPKVALISYGFVDSPISIAILTFVNRLINIDGQPVRVDWRAAEETLKCPRLKQADIVVPEALDEACGTQGRSGTGVDVGLCAAQARHQRAQAKAQMQPVFDYTLSLDPSAIPQ